MRGRGKQRDLKTPLPGLLISTNSKNIIKTPDDAFQSLYLCQTIEWEISKRHNIQIDFDNMMISQLTSDNLHPTSSLQIKIHTFLYPLLRVILLDSNRMQHFQDAFVVLLSPQHIAFYTAGALKSLVWKFDLVDALLSHRLHWLP